MYTQTRETQKVTSPARAWRMLQEGHERFRAGSGAARDRGSQVAATASGEFPIAFVLGCSDSRVPPELVFDQGLGDIASTRLAGPALTDEILGSMEFAVQVLGVKLVLVLGHSNCRAVKSLCEGKGPDDFGGLLADLDQTRRAVARETDPLRCGAEDEDFVRAVSEAHVRGIVAQLRERSPLLKQRLVAERIAAVAAMYDVRTGIVQSLTPTPD